MHEWKATVYCPKKGLLTMICDVVICTHYLLLGPIGTVMHYYHVDYSTGNDYTRPMVMFEQYEMCEMLSNMWIYDEIMFVQLCTILPRCMAPWCYIVLCESTFLVANKLTSYSYHILSNEPSLCANGSTVLQQFT